MHKIVSAPPATTPKTIVASHTGEGHESVFHKICIDTKQANAKQQLSASTDGSFTRDVSEVKSGTGVFDIGSRLLFCNGIISLLHSN